MLTSLLTIIGGVYLGLCLILYVFQERYVYFPTRELAVTPAAYGLDYEELWLTTADGVHLHGWYVPAPATRGAILFLHGNGGNISHRLDTLKIFHDLGLAALIIDYRGYGASGGRPSEEGTYLDAQAAWRHLLEVKGYSQDRIVLFGRSLGGAVAAWLAARTRPAGLIVESTFTSVEDMGRHYYPFLPVRWLTRIHYPVLGYLRQVQSPVLIVHSPDDEIVPYNQGRRLYEAAPMPKYFLELIGDHNHGFMLSGPRYVQGLEKFLSNVLEGG
jgi:hypothetical protein